MKKIILLFCILSLHHAVKAQSGFPDPTFGNNGAIVTPAIAPAISLFLQLQENALYMTDGTIYLVLQPDDKTKIARRLSNGNIDSGYGNNGYSVVVSMNCIHRCNTARRKDCCSRYHGWIFRFYSCQV